MKTYEFMSGLSPRARKRIFHVVGRYLGNKPPGSSSDSEIVLSRFAEVIARRRIQNHLPSFEDSTSQRRRVPKESVRSTGLLEVYETLNRLGEINPLFYCEHGKRMASQLESYSGSFNFDNRKP